MKENESWVSKIKEEDAQSNDSPMIYMVILLMIIAMFVGISFLQPSVFNGVFNNLANTFGKITGTYSSIFVTTNVNDNKIEYNVFLESDDALFTNKYIYAIDYNDSQTELNNFMIDTFFIQDNDHYIRLRDGLLMEKNTLDDSYKAVMQLNKETMEKLKVTNDNAALFKENKNIRIGSTFFTYNLEFKTDDINKVEKLYSYLRDMSYWDKVRDDISRYESKGNDLDFLLLLG